MIYVLVVQSFQLCVHSTNKTTNASDAESSFTEKDVKIIPVAVEGFL